MVEETGTTKQIEYLKLKKDFEEFRHNNRIEELKAELENAQKIHDLQLEVIRIKSAEIRRSQERRSFNN